MNGIYQTIRRALVNGSSCTSEFSKPIKQRKSYRVITCFRSKKSFMIQVVATLQLAGLGGVFAQTLTYDGTNISSPGVAVLEPASNLANALPLWLGIDQGDQGVIYKELNVWVPLNADLVIDYNSGTAPQFVIGGFSSMVGFTAEDNKVSLINGTVNGPVYGALLHNTMIYSDMTGEITGDDTSADASIGRDAYAIAYNNKVNMENGFVVTGDIYGGNATGWLEAGNATAGGNATAVSSGESFVNVQANAQAQAETNGSMIKANSNIIMVTENASITGSLYGGSANLALQGGNATAGGAYAQGANANANAIANALAFVIDSTVVADSNIVTVNANSPITGKIYGGSTNLALQGGNATAGDARVTGYNFVNVGASAYAHAYIENSKMTADNNIVSIGKNTLITGSIYGGSTSVTLQGGSAIAGNGIGMNGFSLSYAYAQISNSSITASSNDVTIGDETSVRESIHGGYALLSVQAGQATGGTLNGESKDANAAVNVTDTQLLANENSVAFNGILENGNIYGGYTQFSITPGTAVKADLSPGDTSVTLTGSTVQAIHNTVTIGENAQISGGNSSLYGGYLEYNPGLAPESYDVFSGNTLNFSAKTPASVQNVGNFEYYNFTINPIDANTNTALISAENISFGANTGNMDDGHQNGQTSKIKVVGIHSGDILNAGDQFLLMSASNSLTGNGNGEISRDVAQQGISLLYDVKTTVDSANKKVTAIILGDEVEVNPQLKSLAEGYLLGSQLVTRGADLIADDAYRAIQEQNPQGGWSPFVVLSGQHNRYNSGSHVKSNDFLMAGGLSYQQKNWTAGAFLEGGWGSYDSYNSFSQVSDVHGTGNDRYYGLGLLGRYQLTSGFYSEASVRFGRNRTKFDTRDIQNFATGEFAHYNLTSNYLSGHVGVGYLVPLTEKNELDISAKYLYTTLGGKSATIAGDRIDFDRVDSNRIRLGIQLNHQYSKTVTFHSGLAYEYEFDGKAGANTYGMSIGDAPSLKGSTGILSIGALVKPRPNLNFDLKLNGYTGKREGFGANMKMTYLF